MKKWVQCKSTTPAGVQCQLTKGHEGYHEASTKLMWGNKVKKRNVIRI